MRDYSAGAAYGDYFVSEETLFPAGHANGRLPAKTQIFALRLNDQPKAYPLSILFAEKLVHDTVGSQPILLVANEGNVNVHGYSYELEYISYSAGGAVRAYERGARQFVLSDDPAVLLDEQGERWSMTEEALFGPAGERLERLGGHLAFWFGWSAAHPNTALYEAP